MSAANVNKYFNHKSFEIKQGRHAHINHVNMINITYNICTVHNKMKHILIYLMHSKLTFIENLLTVRETYNLTMFTALIFLKQIPLTITFNNTLKCCMRVLFILIFKSSVLHKSINTNSLGLFR